MSLRILAVIPARAGSVRVRRKNLAILGGKTLVRRAIETTIAAACFDSIVLTSDDHEILREADDLSEVIQLRRPDALAADTAHAYDAVCHALHGVEADGRGPFDAVAVVQCTSPFTTPGDLRGAVEMLERTGAGSVVSVVRLEGNEHPLKLKRMEGDRLLPFLGEDDGMRLSDELPEVWIRNGSVYLCRRETLEAGSLVSDDVRGYPMPRERSHDIDTMTDLAFAEFLLERQERGVRTI